ncbi:MAG: 23S rRNA (uracil(1939)-C(5))-methyltransferase RlmD [Ignavibacteria bacterium]
MNYKKNDLIIVRSQKMVSQGICIGKINGRVVFIENCLPDELVEARIVKIRKDYLEAKAERIIETSKKRIEPRCKFFGLCGGCKLQNLAYEEQLKIKKGFVEDAFKRIAKLNDIRVNDTIGSQHQYFYRNKMEFSFAKRWLFSEQKYSDREKEFALGLHIPKQYEKVLHLDWCFLQSDFSNRVRNFIGEFLYHKNISIHSLKNKKGLLKSLLIRESKHTNEKLVALVTTQFNEKLMFDLAIELKANFPEISTFVNILSSPELSSTLAHDLKIIYGKGYIIEKLFDYKFEIYPNTFFQTNTIQAESLFGIVKKYFEECLNEIQKTNSILIDLYSGVGVIGIIFSKYFDEVLAFEEVKESVEASKRNALINEVSNIKFFQQNLNDGFKLPVEYFSKNKTIIVDPPRAGMSEKTIESILKIKPEKIIYISCNPDTQARDISKLKDFYKIELIQPVDMFPQTFHTENIAVLKIFSHTT